MCQSLPPLKRPGKHVPVLLQNNDQLICKGLSTHLQIPPADSFCFVGGVCWFAGGGATQSAKCTLDYGRGYESGAGGVDCCDSPHPTSTTAAIVVSRRCFIYLQLSILYPSCRRVCGGGLRFRYVSKGWPNLALCCQYICLLYSPPHLRRLAVRRFPCDCYKPPNAKESVHHSSHSRPYQQRCAV